MGRVLKAPAHNRLPKVLALGSARAEAMLEEARAKSELVLEAAAARAADLEERSAAAAVLRFESLALRAEAELGRLSASREGELVRLAIGVAEKVVSRSLELDPSIVLDMVREAISKLPRATAFVVRTHPDCVAIVARELPTFDVTSDASLAHGDVIVESDVGRVDARIAVRLDAIRKVLGDDPSSERSG